MVGEDPAFPFLEAALPVWVVDQGVAGMAMLALERRAGGDDLDAWKMARRPPALLRLGRGLPHERQ